MEDQQPQQKVATEVAEKEFFRWLVSMDLDHKADEAKLSKEDLASFAKAKSVLVRAMERASLVLTDQGLEFTPQLGNNRKPILFAEPKGAAMLAADKHGEGENVRKTYAVLADMTGEEIKRFSLMPRRDIAVCEAIFGLFFG